jgi:hypothetical protein
MTQHRSSCVLMIYTCMLNYEIWVFYVSQDNYHLSRGKVYCVNVRSVFHVHMRTSVKFNMDQIME